MEPSTLAIQAGLSLLVAVATATIVSAFNRRFFRDELGENEYIEDYIGNANKFWMAFAAVHFDTVQMIGELDTELNKLIKAQKNQQEIDSKMNSLRNERFVPILSKTSRLTEYYFYLSTDTLAASREFEDLIYSIRDFQKFEQFVALLPSLSEQYELVFRSVRTESARLIRREKKVSTLLAEVADIVPKYIRDALR